MQPLTNPPAGGGNPLGTCSLTVEQTLPLVCIGSLFSFLCGVGIGANDLSANFAMVVGSGSLNMRKAIIYCAVFELLGAAFMGGHVSSTIRGGIVAPSLFRANRDVVVLGMVSAGFAASAWLYLSTVFGLPVSITHTVIGSILGFALFATGGFQFVLARGLGVIMVSWVAAPLAAFAVTAAIFYVMRRDVFRKKGRSFAEALRVLPFCLFASLLVDFFFIIIEQPPLMARTIAAYVPLWLQYIVLLIAIAVFCLAVNRWVFPQVAEAALEAQTFVWESPAIRTELEQITPEADERERRQLEENLSLFRPPAHLQPGGSGTAATDADTSLRLTVSGSGEVAPESPGSSATARGVLRPSKSTAQRSPMVSRSASVAPLSIGHAEAPLFRKGNSVRLAAVPSSAVYAPDPGQSLTTTTTSHPHHNYGTLSVVSPEAETLFSSTYVAPEGSPTFVREADTFGDEDWNMDHPMQPISFGGLLVKPFNPRAEFLFTGLQVVAGSMSSFVHGAVAGANATATFVILYDALTNHELGETDMSTSWAVLPAMLGIAVGMFALGASLMKTVGVELVTVTPARGWCIQIGGTLVTMVLTGIGIPVSLSQSQVGAAIGCGVLDAKWSGVSWRVVSKIMIGWVVTLVISAATSGLALWTLMSFMC